MVESVRARGIPIYIQIREALRAEIVGGKVRRGQQLPSEGELAARFNVSRMTIRGSIDGLVSEGLLYRRRGVGTFIADPHLHRDSARPTSLSDDEDGKDVRVSVLEIKVIPATARVAAALDTPPGSHVIRIKNLRYTDGAPVTVETVHIPYRLFPGVFNENLEVPHLWMLLEKGGIRVGRAIQRLEAREASKSIARLMGIREGAPVLFQESTLYADDGTPVEFSYCYNRGDLFSLTVGLERGRHVDQ